MTATSDAVDDSVPFTLADLVRGGATFAKVREVRSARLIDYQVAGEGGEMPEGLFFFLDIRDLAHTQAIFEDALAGGSQIYDLALHPVYEGDIEESSFI